MALYALMALVAFAMLRTLGSWRKGIIMMIVIAAVQDPLRKLVPGTPGWLALASVPVFIAVVVVSIGSTRRWWAEFRKNYPPIAKSLQVLAVLSLPAAIISATYSAGSWMLTAFGALSYASIFLAMVAGFHYARSLADVRRLLALYCGIHGVMLTGGILEYLGLFSHWTILGSAALGYDWIRWVPGYTVDMLAGFYRSSDVMGWHASSVCMLSLLLAFTSRGMPRNGWVLLTALAFLALLVCGRRKMVYMLPVFLLALGWIYWQAGRSGKVWAIFVLLLLPAVSLKLSGDFRDEGSSNMRYYTETSNETLDRFQEHGWESVITTIEQSGFFGEGLGTATPGSHHIQVERPRVWQESTPSRLVVELGVPGALAFVAVLLAIVTRVWRLTMRLLHERRASAIYAAGLMAFFLANLGSLTVSGQILADPFVASFLGLLVGLTLSLSRLHVKPAAAQKSVPTAFDTNAVAANSSLPALGQQ